MKTLLEIQQVFSNLLSQDSLSSNDLQQLLTDLMDFIVSADYQQFDFETKEQVNDLLAGIESKLEEQRSKFLSKDSMLPHQQTEVSQHDKVAEELMDKAEREFLAGNLATSIRLFVQVLEIEPSWQRAQDLRDQARRYQRWPDIPLYALPFEAFLNYEKAQSAVRLGRYNDAKYFFGLAQEALIPTGIMRWRAGDEFQIRLASLIQAESIYTEAISLFNQGEIENAIQKLDTIYKETGISRYKDLADKYRQYDATYQQVSDIFFSEINPPIDVILEAIKAAGALGGDFDGTLALDLLRSRVDLIKLGLIGFLKQEINHLKSQAEQAKKSEIASQHASKAQEDILLVIKLGITTEMFQSVITEMYEIHSYLDKFIQISDDPLMTTGKQRLEISANHNKKSQPSADRNTANRPSIFICYSHADEKWKDRLITHLGVLREAGYLDLWDDRRIEIGSDWHQEIIDAITGTQAAILMITANFLTSRFILDTEIPLLLQKRGQEGLKIFPIIVKPCLWQEVKWLAALQVRPRDGKPLSSGRAHQIDSNFTAFANEIYKLINTKH